MAKLRDASNGSRSPAPPPRAWWPAVVARAVVDGAVHAPFAGLGE